MMARPRANDVPDLVRDLGSRSRVRVDTARARLAIVGSRAVEALIEALEGENDRIRARAMPLLALIQDVRGRAPLVAMLLDRSWRLRAIAARSLARFPSPETTAALARVVAREGSERVRVVAVQSLVEHYVAGEDHALGAALELLLDPSEPPTVRVAALPLLRALPAAHSRSIRTRLEQDPVAAIRSAATEPPARAGAADPTDGAEVAEWLAALGSDDYGVWYAAVQRLAAAGPAAVGPLIGELRRRAHDPEFCARVGMALKALGPHRGDTLGAALDEIEEPLPLQVLVEVAGAWGRKALIYRLRDVIDRVGALAARREDGFDPLQRVRAKAHLELARIGSRVAIEDLRGALADGDRRVDLEMLSALRMIGKREEIPLLLRAHEREDAFVQQRIGEVVREIMKRERIRRNDRLFVGLSGAQRKALDAALPAPAVRARRRARTAPGPT